MKRQPILLPVACLATMLAVGTGVGWSAPAAKSGIIAYEIQTTIGGKAQKMDQKTWFKGDKAREEADTPGGKVISVSGPSGAYMLQPGRSEWMKLNFPKQRHGVAPAGFGDLTQFKRQAKKVGSEKVGRYQTEIYEKGTDITFRPGTPKSHISARLWLSPTLPVPVKIVTKMPQGESVWTLKSAQLNVAIPDTLFQLPKGTKVRPAPMMPPRGAPR